MAELRKEITRRDADIGVADSRRQTTGGPQPVAGRAERERPGVCRSTANRAGPDTASRDTFRYGVRNQPAEGTAVDTVVHSDVPGEQTLSRSQSTYPSARSRSSTTAESVPGSSVALSPWTISRRSLCGHSSYGTRITGSSYNPRGWPYSRIGTGNARSPT